MIIEKSRRMMRRTFERVRYRYAEKPTPAFAGRFGVYVHVPFCRTTCSFCPFYKERYDEHRMAGYLEALLREIEATPMEGTASWVYFGGGTPSLLGADEVSLVLDRLRSRLSLASVGLEALPSALTPAYLDGLVRAGVTKLSVGVESLSTDVLRRSGRAMAGTERVTEAIASAIERGLFVNADMMVGLSGQDAQTFSRDIEGVADIGPSQITLYPYMVVRGLNDAPAMPESVQFELIEAAWEHLAARGYTRRGVWTFANADDLYDSSRDELIHDYAGFGPSAFSTFAEHKFVNPHLDVYLRDWEAGVPTGFVAPRTRASQDWRRVARMLYDLSVTDLRDLPAYIRVYLLLLEASGYLRRGTPTRKGVLLAHGLTKTVVESLPFPLQNPAAVENYDEYAHQRPGLPQGPVASPVERRLLG
jgi:coproporphyrinogen III oxidase-like Fe-S oxidoreductase